MNVILQASVVLYGIIFHADIGAYQTVDACNIAANATAGPNWELTCRNDNLSGQVWSGGLSRYETCSWNGSRCRR